MKKAYSKVRVQISCFESIDIICTSGPIEGEPHPFNAVNAQENYATPSAELLIDQAKTDVICASGPIDGDMQPFGGNENKDA